MKRCITGLLGLLSLLLAVRAAEPASRSRLVLAGGDAAGLSFTTGTPVIETRPGGGKALRFDAPFQCRLDLQPQNVDSRQYDLLALTVKADRAARLRIAVENHPRVGDISYWYVLDSMRGAFEWRTLWLDLRLPEEVKSGDDPRSPWREGMGADSAAWRGVQLQGSVMDLKSQKQGPARSLWLGEVRFIRQAVALDWDQTKAPYTWGRGEDLVYRYPLTLTNRTDAPLTARVTLAPVAPGAAQATVSPAVVPLAAGQTTTVEAKLVLPAAVAAVKAPLYCERFLVTADAEGIADSTVTVLRSSDPIPLTVTVPIPEEQLKFPLFPRPKSLPAAVLRFDEKSARELAANDPAALIANALAHGLYRYGENDPHKAALYRQTLTSAAYLYDLTGEEQHLRTARRLLQSLPETWRKWAEAERQQPVQLVSSGIVARWGDYSHFTLGLGWLVMGTQRSPYLYSDGGNARNGSCSSLAYAFDIMAPHLDEAERQRVITGFFLPAGLQSRNHYVGDGNQQMTADVNALYAGLVARNWPLVSFAYDSDHGLLGVLDTCFDDDGVQLRKNYQTYTLRPVLWACELLHGVGLDIYQRAAERLAQTVAADSAAKGQGGRFEDVYFWQFVKEQRLR